jgi:hypothetical protein
MKKQLPLDKQKMKTSSSSVDKKEKLEKHNTSNISIECNFEKTVIFNLNVEKTETFNSFFNTRE